MQSNGFNFWHHICYPEHPSTTGHERQTKSRQLLNDISSMITCPIRPKHVIDCVSFSNLFLISEFFITGVVLNVINIFIKPYFRYLYLNSYIFPGGVDISCMLVSQESLGSLEMIKSARLGLKLQQLQY